MSLERLTRTVRLSNISTLELHVRDDDRGGAGHEQDADIARRRRGASEDLGAAEVMERRHRGGVARGGPGRADEIREVKRDRADPDNGECGCAAPR